MALIEDFNEKAKSIISNGSDANNSDVNNNCIKDSSTYNNLDGNKDINNDENHIDVIGVIPYEDDDEITIDGDINDEGLLPPIDDINIEIDDIRIDDSYFMGLSTSDDSSGDGKVIDDKFIDEIIGDEEPIKE